MTRRRQVRPRARAGCAALLLLTGACAREPAPQGDVPTWSRDIAPLVFEHCAPCHRPGEAAPFSLLTYRQVQKRATQIAEVTARRYMPPWLPDPAVGEFRGARRLSADEIDRLQRWVAAGAPEGDPDAAPEPPRFTEGWQLGEPDLVVAAAEPYLLPAGGRDTFRNLVLPVPISRARYVRAVEIRPGSKRVVHHGVLRVDAEGTCRELDARDPEPGFGGMDMATAQDPGGGHMLGWLPGRSPAVGPEDGAWTLEPGTDLVLQLHMLPSGRPEPIQPVIGLHFTDRAPTRHPIVLKLESTGIRIPAGVSDHVVGDAFTLPAPVTLTAVQPHAHYVGREVHIDAELPGGAVRGLLRIHDWDFNWQDVYHYAEPIELPAGTVVRYRFVYDNSAANPRNPFDPPRTIVFGQRSTDEMCEVYLQVYPRDEPGRQHLRAALLRHKLARTGEHPRTLATLAGVLVELGKKQEAAALYEKALQLEPRLPGVRNNLGTLHREAGDLARAIICYRQEIELNPGLVAPRLNLGRALERKDNRVQAIEEYRKALQVEPRNVQALLHLARALRAEGQGQEAARCFASVLKLDPDCAEARDGAGALGG